MNAITPVNSNAEAYRASTDAAGLCKEIVVKTAMKIQNKRYVTVEGWQAIAIAHGCTASADNVERVNDEGMTGFKAVGMIRRMSDGIEIARAEGFLGDDEGMWARRPVYARRAMAQTRAISRACRSAFAHVVVMMDAGLATTPAEEIPNEGFDNGAVVDVTATHAEPEKPEPIAGIHKIKERLRAMMTAGNEDITLAAFKELKRANRADLKTIRDAGHAWWTGDGEDFEGFGPWIARREAELDPDNMATRAILDMKENAGTPEALAQWLDNNSGYIEKIDGADRRRFDAAYEAYAGELAARCVRAG